MAVSSEAVRMPGNFFSAEFSSEKEEEERRQ
jgi:hypothetical protein